MPRLINRQTTPIYHRGEPINVLHLNATDLLFHQEVFLVQLHIDIRLFFYRNEYTYQYIYDQSNASSSSSCSCEVRGQAIPGKQPAYRWVDIPHTKECPRHRREGHAVSMSSSSGLTINSITCKTTRQSEVTPPPLPMTS